MNKSRGRISFYRLFGPGDLKLNNAGLYVDRLIQEFLKIGEAVAARWIQMPKGVLFLQQAAGAPDSGAIYVYDREAQALYLACFDGPDDHLTLPEFLELMCEYDLLHYAEQPAALRKVAPDPTIYAVLDRSRQEFYLVSFEGEELSLEEFQRLAPECAVFPYASNHPHLVRAQLRTASA